MKATQLLFEDENEFDTEFYKEFPRILYKYRTFNEFGKKSLTDKELYFANPGKDFNDPYDSKIRFRYEELTPDEFLTWALRVVKKRNPLFSEFEIQKEAERLFKEKGGDKEYWQEASYDQLRKLHERYGILCLTPHPDKILMWSHYGNSHQGFCTGYDSKELYKFMKGGMGKIVYSPDFVNLKPNEDMNDYHKQYIIKSLEWQYEDEVRVVKSGLSGQTLQIPGEIICEIILGASMPEKDIENIISLASNDNEFKHVNLFKAELDERNFKININPFNPNK